MAYDSFATCCAVFSVLGIVQLLLFGRMFSSRAISFSIQAVEAGWDLDAKAKSCYNGAIIYAATLLISVVARIYFRRNDATNAALRSRAGDAEVLIVPADDSSAPLRTNGQF